MLMSRKPYPLMFPILNRHLSRLFDAFAGGECAAHAALRKVFNGMRYIVKMSCRWRWMPNALPPWEIVYQQAPRWLKRDASELWLRTCAGTVRLSARSAEEGDFLRARVQAVAAVLEISLQTGKRLAPREARRKSQQGTDSG